MFTTTDQTFPPETTQPPVLRAREITPWENAVAGSLLLQDLARLIARHVVLPKWGAETLALWSLHTYAFHLRQVSTYIGLESPEKRCGKTTLLGVLSQLVNRPVVAANISSSAFFRVIEEVQPTLLIFCHFLLTKESRTFSRTLVEHLKNQFDRPWAETKAGKGVTERWLAHQLRPYGIHPRTLWIGREVAKGYLKEDLDGLFKRYITKSDFEELKLRNSPPPGIPPKPAPKSTRPPSGVRPPNGPTETP